MFARLLAAMVVGLVLAASDAIAQEAKPGPILSVNFHRFSPAVTEAERAAYLTVRATGAKRVRIPIWWNLYQPRKPVPDQPVEHSLAKDWFERLDERTELIQSVGMESEFVLIWSPQWSNGFETKMCGDKPCNFSWYCLPGEAGETDPKCWGDGGRFVERDEDLITFVTYLVNRYKDRGVRYWAACNECLANPNELRTFWWGTFDDLLHRFEIVNRVVKGIDPSLQTVGDEGNDPQKAERFLCGGGSKLVDIVAGHVYPWPNFQRFLDFLDGYTNHRGEYIRGYREVMKKCAPGKPFWLTEVGEVYNPHATTYQSDMWNRLLPEIYSRDWINEYFVFDLLPASEIGAAVFKSDGTPMQSWRNISHWATVYPSLPKAVIDPSLPGLNLPGLDERSGHNDFILVSNRKDSPVDVKITLVNSDGDGITRTESLAPNSRKTIGVASYPGFKGQRASASIQADTSDIQFVGAEHSAYWGPGWRGGRSSEATQASEVLYLAEGALGFFTEYITVYHTHPEPTDVQFTFLLEGGAEVEKTIRIGKGPGWKTIIVNDIPEVTTSHSTVLRGFNPNGQPTKISAEMTMTWGNEREGLSIPAIAHTSTEWYFAEGAASTETQGFRSFLLMANPQNHEVATTVIYLMDDKRSFRFEIVIPARSRYTLPTPEHILGGFGYSVKANAPILAVRSMYWGEGWEGGSASVGAHRTGTKWLISEGVTGWFSTYVLVANPTARTANVILKFMLEDGTTRRFPYTIGPQSRITVRVNDLADLASATFSVEVSSENGVGIVAERATFWGTSWYGGHAGLASLVQ
jgi:hypothetical protein